MTRQSISMLMLTCGLDWDWPPAPVPENEGETGQEVRPPPRPATHTAPADRRRQLWKPYLLQVIAQHMEGVTDRVYPYYLRPTARIERRRSSYVRQSRTSTAVISRTVLPGNMLAFGSPDSAKMADLMLSAFSGAKPDALKGSQVLFIGKAEDSARVQAESKPRREVHLRRGEVSAIVHAGRRSARRTALQAHGTSHQRALRQLRCLRAGLPEPGHFPGRDDLPDRPGALHRVRRPFRRAAVHRGVPGRVHRQGPAHPETESQLLAKLRLLQEAGT
jgi:hypothetical protein